MESESQPQPDYHVDSKMPRKLNIEMSLGDMNTPKYSGDTDKDSANDKTMQSHVTVCDINQAMLDVGEKKAEELGYRTGDIQYAF